MKALRWFVLLSIALIGLGVAYGQDSDPFPGYVLISRDNASQLVSIGDLGYGHPLLPYWSPNGQSIAFPTTNGFLLWSVGDERPAFIRKSLQSLTWLNNQEIAIADPDGIIHSWDSRTGEWQRLFETGLPYVYGLSYNPQADVLSMRGGDPLVSLYERETGELVGEVPCRFSRGFPQQDYVFSPDGYWFACADDTQVTMLHLSSGEIIVLTENAARFVPQFSSDSTMLAYGTADEKVHLIRTEDQTELIAFEGAYPGAFSPDNRLYVVGFYQADEMPSQTAVWDIEANREVASFLGGRSYVFSADGALIAYERDLDNQTDCRYNELRVYNLVTDADTRIIEGRAAVTYAGPYPIEFFGDDLWVIYDDETTQCDQVKAALWHPATGIRQISVFPYRKDYALSPDGRYMASFDVPAFSAASVTWRVIAADDGRDMFPPVEFAPADYWHSLTFSPDGQWIATGGGNINVQKWFLGDMGETNMEFGSTGYPSQAPVNDIAYSPDGRLIAIASDAYFSSGQLLDSETGEILSTFSSTGGRLNTVAFSSDGQSLIVGGGNGIPMMVGVPYLLEAMPGQITDEPRFPTPTREFMSENPDQRTEVVEVAIHPQGTLVAASSLDGAVHLWDAETGDILRVIHLEGEAWGMTFSPDGDSYAASGEGGAVIVARVGTDEAARLPIDAGDEIMTFFDVTYNLNGSVIAALGYGRDSADNPQGALYLWDAQTLERLNRIETENDGLPFHLEFSPNGELLSAVVGRWGLIHLWGIENER